jgi:2-polyprenyl-3-methyl-5-hydroxy-6-metoxy-1,4-benzoquinol methylase
MDMHFDVPSNWYENFFTPAANAFWENMVPAEATMADLAFLQRHLGAPPPARILDMPCGAGRHSLGLAEHGYDVTGVDLSEDAIARASAAALERGAAAAFVRSDMRGFEAVDPFDAAICLGNSISYFDPADTFSFFRKLAGNLKAGGRLVLDSHCCAESIFPLSGERRIDFDGGSYDARLRYEPARSRLCTAAELRLAGETHALRYAHYIVTAGELVRILAEAGLRTLALYGDTEDVPFETGSPRLLLVAARE